MKSRRRRGSSRRDGRHRQQHGGPLPERQENPNAAPVQAPLEARGPAYDPSRRVEVRDLTQQVIRMKGALQEVLKDLEELLSNLRQLEGQAEVQEAELEELRQSLDEVYQGPPGKAFNPEPQQFNRPQARPQVQEPIHPGPQNEPEHQETVSNEDQESSEDSHSDEAPQRLERLE